MPRSRNRPRNAYDSYLDHFHREAVYKYLPPKLADQLTMCDIDSCEACQLCGEPIALIERKYVKLDAPSGPIHGFTVKVTGRLGTRAELPAYLVECKETYRPERENKPGQMKMIDHRIERLWVTSLTPKSTRHEMTPRQYAIFLIKLRVDHWQNNCENPAAINLAMETLKIRDYED